MRWLLTALLALALTGCDGSPLAEPTYPGSGAYAEVPLGALLSVETGRYNTVAFVQRSFVCPPEADCVLPGSVVLVRTPLRDREPQDGLSIPVDQPAQFRVGERYTFSVEVVQRGADLPQIRVIGYSAR